MGVTKKRPIWYNGHFASAFFIAGCNSVSPQLTPAQERRPRRPDRFAYTRGDRAFDAIRQDNAARQVCNHGTLACNLLPGKAAKTALPD